MHLPRRAVEEFRAAWREDFGEELPFEEAQVRAERFLWTIYEMMVIRPSDKPEHSEETSS